MAGKHRFFCLGTQIQCNRLLSPLSGFSGNSPARWANRGIHTLWRNSENCYPHLTIVPRRGGSIVSTRLFTSKPLALFKHSLVSENDEKVSSKRRNSIDSSSSLNSAHSPQLGAPPSLLKITDGNSNSPISDLEDLISENGFAFHPPRAIGDNLVRCTIFDREGNVKVVSGEFKRAEMLSKHGLLPRDLRKLDTGISSIVPSILVRRNSILANLLHIRALIKADMVLIFDVYGSADSQTQSLFMYDLGHKLRHGRQTMGGLPYELRALEAIFISVITALDAEMQVHTSVVSGILADLEDDIDREKLWHLLIQSKKLSRFLQKATLIRDAMDELLEQDEDLAGLYLTEKAKGKPRLPTDDHSEAEMLVESYYKHCDEIVQTVGNLVSNIRSTEEIVNIILDANRNSLMLLDLKFQIGTLGLGTGAFIAALYGMNLQNLIEESEWGFWGISGFATILTSMVILISLRNLHRVQHVTMMSSAESSRRKAMSKSRISLKNKILSSNRKVNKNAEAAAMAAAAAVEAAAASSTTASSFSHPYSYSPPPSQPPPSMSVNHKNRSKVWNWLVQGPNIKHY